MIRTHTCGELRTSDTGAKVCLQGWVRFSRDHGGVAFIDLADRYGITQVVFDPEDLPKDADAGNLAETMRTFTRESAVSIRGTVRSRVAGTEDERNPTGSVEVLITSAELLGRSGVPPLEIGDQKEGVLPSEDIRMKYRYLDLRRTEMIRTLEFRSRFVHMARQYLESQGFLEIETPILGRSTPEGARDYIVPSRVHPGTFYALAQSPQLFKQMLMVGGLDRYYQVARCFRDEDSRKDRQPEFTQLDMEMSFVEEKDIQDMIEGMLAHAWEGIYGKKLQTPFRRISYKEAMWSYGSDKPDLRFGLKLNDVTDVAGKADYEIFRRIISKGGIILGIRIESALAEKIGRNEVDRYIEYAKKAGLGGLTWMRAKDGTLESNIVKYFSPEVISSLIGKLAVKDGDLLFLFAGPEKATQEGAGQVRLKLAEDLDLIPEGVFEFAWLVDCPLFETDPVSGRLTTFHHPFVKPRSPLDEKDAKGSSFDLVLNGTELGSGSLRINDPELQRSVFSMLGISEEKAEEDFGFFLEALGYGAPPHGGIALGIDRLIAMLTGKDTIRDTIAFPKNKRAQSLFDDSPAKVDDEKLEELQIMSIAIGDLEDLE
ncbi:MAG: aspartate--tRNA ligase [Candidatus Methanomethylophilaceae archaeon]|nr:aspartate--tRNA ligase [Candidatus Methanomethylophilaceae archaeon]